MSNIGVLPPIDYSTNSGDDIRVQIQVQAKEAGAEFSAPSGGDFTLIVNPVASQPTISGEQSTISGLEDELPDPDNINLGIKISKGIVFNVNDSDGSESIVAVNVSGVLPGYALVDVNNNAIGISDGAGTVTLTNVQKITGTTNFEFSSDVFLRSPNDQSGSLDLTISAISKEENSGATSVSETKTITVQIDPVADLPSISVPESSEGSPIKIGEFVDGSTYAIPTDYIRLTTSIAETNPEETMHALIRFKKNGQNSADFKLNDGISPSLIDENDPEYSKYMDAEYDTYLLTEDDINNKLQEHLSGLLKVKLSTSTKYVVEVIGRSTDGSSVRSEKHEIVYEVAAVAKQPIFQDINSELITTENPFEINDLIKTGSSETNRMKIALDVLQGGGEEGQDQITLLVTGLPSNLTDFISFEIEDGTKIGARNADGSVYVLTLDQLDQNNDNTVTAVDDPFYLVLADETQINDQSIDYVFDKNINDVLNSEGAETFVNGDYVNLKNADGITLQQQKFQ